VRVLLDTTYFLPAIGISVRGLPRGVVLELISRECAVLMSEATIFEILAKGAKYVALGALRPERVVRGVRSLLYDDRIRRVPMHDARALLTALELRRLLSDFIDCLILSAAVNYADALLTEDEEIHALSRSEDFSEVVRGVNPGFKVVRYNELKGVLSG